MVQLKGIVERLSVTACAAIRVVFERVIIPVPSVVIIRIQNREPDSLEQVETKLKQL